MQVITFKMVKPDQMTAVTKAITSTVLATWVLIQWGTQWTILSLSPRMHFQSNRFYSKTLQILIKISDIHSCGAALSKQIPNLKHMMAKMS